MEKLDLENVRIYSNTKAGIIDAMDLIGQDVYMSDDENFEDYYKYKLVGVKVIDDYCRFLGNEGKETYTFAYKHFILVKDVKFKEEKEKKLRPFKSVFEFNQKTGFSIGNIIFIRKTDDSFEEECVINGFKYLNIKYLNTGPRDTYIIIGSDKYTFEELKNDYLYFKDGEWHQFGVCDE